MRDLLIDLDALLKEKNKCFYKQIGNALDKREIIRLLSENNLYLCEDLIELYSEHGWIDSQTIYNGPYVEFCSLGCLVDLKSAVSQFIKDRKSENYLEGKLPIVIRNDGDYMAVDLKKTSPTRGCIYVCEPSITLSEEMIRIYDSIPLFIQSVAECYKKGAYISEDGYLDIDFDKEYEISQSLNPRSPYWIEDIGEMLNS